MAAAACTHACVWCLHGSGTCVLPSFSKCALVNLCFLCAKKERAGCQHFRETWTPEPQSDSCVCLSASAQAIQGARCRLGWFRRTRPPQWQGPSAVRAGLGCGLAGPRSHQGDGAVCVAQRGQASVGFQGEREMMTSRRLCMCSVEIMQIDIMQS